MTSFTPDFAPVPSEEMGFALTLFVKAANRRIPPSPATETVFDDVCALLYTTLCSEVDRPSPTEAVRSGQEATLYTAFRALCSHYERDPLQASICARVLAFYFLMERTAGAALADWTQPLPDAPGLVGLHPAVLEAIGKVRLNGSVLLSPSAFPRLVAEVANRAEPVMN